MKAKSDTAQPEFSRPLAVDKIPAAGVDESLKAREEERQRLAERFGLLDLPLLRAELSVRPVRAGAMFAVEGRMVADVVQQCVVTLEVLPAHIEQEVDTLFAAPELVTPEAGSAQLEMDEEETEAIINGVIDLGELVAQYLGTALDPYPRKPGIAFVEAQYGADEALPNPFAKLMPLTKKPKSGE